MIILCTKWLCGMLFGALDQSEAALSHVGNGVNQCKKALVERASDFGNLESNFGY